jgi:hypothetical protein
MHHDGDDRRSGEQLAGGGPRRLPEGDEGGCDHSDERGSDTVVDDARLEESAALDDFVHRTGSYADEERPCQ